MLPDSVHVPVPALLKLSAFVDDGVMFPLKSPLPDPVSRSNPVLVEDVVTLPASVSVWPTTALSMIAPPLLPEKVWIAIVRFVEPPAEPVNRSVP